MKMADLDALTLTVLLLGRPQCGKSATGNTLLGSHEFESRLSLGPVTQGCQLCCRTFHSFMRRQGRETALRLRVLDTPAYPNSLLSRQEVKQAVRDALRLKLRDGVHVLLLVVRADVPLCEEDCQFLQLAEDLFGSDWKNHGLLLITHRDALQKAGVQEEEHLKQASGTLRTLLDSVESRHHFVDNSMGWLQEERRPILEKLAKLSGQNKHRELPFKFLVSLNPDTAIACGQNQEFVVPEKGT
uniref:GTPase IMAP family member GIMD1 n=1 Tax=Lepisosteus oculatus TaxID=7918 RepID=W5N4N8_LEPOC|nr:PREDICTED: GTPase IMAP family member GIMD1 [Lepisosteus oculatus]